MFDEENQALFDARRDLSQERHEVRGSLAYHKQEIKVLEERETRLTTIIDNLPEPKEITK